MNAFITSNAFSGPPKPASASATMGASQYVSVSPPAAWIWSARSNALFSGPTEPGPRGGGGGGEPVRLGAALGRVDLVGPQQRVVQAPHERRPAVGRVEALI